MPPEYRATPEAAAAGDPWLVLGVSSSEYLINAPRVTGYRQTQNIMFATIPRARVKGFLGAVLWPVHTKFAVQLLIGDNRGWCSRSTI